LVWIVLLTSTLAAVKRGKQMLESLHYVRRCRSKDGALANGSDIEVMLWDNAP
jgi:hypothetical protein